MHFGRTCFLNHSLKHIYLKVSSSFIFFLNVSTHHSLFSNIWLLPRENREKRSWKSGNRFQSFWNSIMYTYTETGNRRKLATDMDTIVYSTEYYFTFYKCLIYLMQIPLGFYLRLRYAEIYRGDAVLHYYFSSAFVFPHLNHFDIRIPRYVYVYN